MRVHHVKSFDAHHPDQAPEPPTRNVPLNGIHILENINTEEMVKDQAWEFLFTLGPARITGGVQAIINPIAIK